MITIAIMDNYYVIVIMINNMQIYEDNHVKCYTPSKTLSLESIVFAPPPPMTLGGGKA